MTKRANLKKFMKKGGSITGFQALTQYGIYRLSDVIFCWRKEGIDINTEMISNGTSKYAKYTFK